MGSRCLNLSRCRAGQKRFKPPSSLPGMDDGSSLKWDKALSALAIILSLIVLLMLILHYPAYVPPAGGPQNLGGAGAAALGAGAAPALSAAGASAPQQVSLDYLFADWCSYCQLTRPALVSVAMRFGPAVSLNEYNEALRSTDKRVAALYADYKARRLFVLFPTIVAHGPKGESALAGMQSEESIQQWLCEQYTQPPAACLNATSSG